jgi:hypothetical protein
MGSTATTNRPVLPHSAANEDGPPPQSSTRADGETSDNAKNASYSAAPRPHAGTVPPKSNSLDIGLQTRTGHPSKVSGECSSTVYLLFFQNVITRPSGCHPSHFPGTSLVQSWRIDWSRMRMCRSPQNGFWRRFLYAVYRYHVHPALVAG